jgi:TetR/AcrR family transcriptional regulator, transcriptional repressor of bet genes
MTSALSPLAKRPTKRTAKSAPDESQARSRELPEVRRLMLIEATTRSIAKYGYPGTTIERICDEAGVSRGLINHHFGSKDELILQSYRKLCDEWAYYTQDMMDGSLEPEEAIRAAVSKNFNPAMFKQEYLGIWLGFYSVIPKNPDLKRLDRALYKQDLANFQTQFERLAAKRKLKLDARLQAIGLMSLMEGLWLQWSLDPKSFSVDEAKAVCLGSIAHLLG